MTPLDLRSLCSGLAEHRADRRSPSDQQRVSRARWVAAGRAATGMFALVAPRRALVPSQRGSLAARRVMRVLGARHLLQAGVEAALPTPAVLTIGAGVDAVHALTCLGFALVGGRRWRRGALVNAVTALGFCALTTATAHTHHSSHDNPRSNNRPRSDELRELTHEPVS